MGRMSKILLSLTLLLFLVACEPLAPAPTPQLIIVTPVPTSTPPPTATPLATRTPVPSPTPDFTPTATPLPCESERGAMLAFDDFRSEIAGENLRYRVYIPPCYVEAQKRYPYTILLHGQAADEIQWDRLGIDEALEQGIRLGATAPMIIVMPYTGSIANRDTFPPNPSYESVILNELIPAIERDFCTWSSAEHRAIGGISRGGFWAYSIAMRHPDVFGKVGSHSGTFPRNTIPPAFNPLDLASNASFLEEANLKMYLDNAANDIAGTGQELLSSRLSARGIPHTYLIHPVGDHSEDYWQAHVSEYLAFYTRDWPRNLNDLPSCAEPSP
jgi:enterochelin esterase-like enzyme